MTDVSIIGIGQTAVAEHWETSLRHLAYQAARAALEDAGLTAVDAIYVGNQYADQLSQQQHLGALIADFVGLRGVEAYRIEAADASGAAALRAGYLAIKSGEVETALVLGVEQTTDVVGSPRTAALSTIMDADYEGAQGATPAALAALLMQRYLHEYGLVVGNFAGFSENAHLNASTNPHAMYRNKLRPEMFANAPAVAPPVSLFDAAPEGDGAAAVILTSVDRARDLVPLPVCITGSAVSTDTLSLHDREELLVLSAANRSAGRAYQQAGITPTDVDLFELHDSFAIMAALSLEAAGFAEQGAGSALANPAGIGRDGQIPVATFGGLKARGHAGGASGVYQAVEAVLQLRGQGGENQVAAARTALIQGIGGLGGTAITHVLQADN